MKCRKCKREIEKNSLFCNWCGTKQIKDESGVRVPTPKRKGSTWYAQVTVDGERVYISAPSEGEYYVKARAAKVGLIEAHKPDNRIVKDLVTEYINARNGTISPSTIDGYERKAKYNLQSLMPLRVKDLTDSTVQKAIDIDKAKYSGKTIKEALALQDEHHYERWQRVMNCPVCKQFDRNPDGDMWEWSLAFYNASIATLEHMAKKVTDENWLGITATDEKIETPEAGEAE